MKFNHGDYVRIAKNINSSMGHLTADCDAIVLGSYADLYGGTDPDNASYSLYLKGKGHVSWYYANQLTLIDRARNDLLKSWKEEIEIERAQKADIDWIFEHGEEVLSAPHGASLETLGKHLGCSNLWGSRGEGVVYFRNAQTILAIAAPFLKLHDKDGFMALASQIPRPPKEGE